MRAYHASQKMKSSASDGEYPRPALRKAVASDGDDPRPPPLRPYYLSEHLPRPASLGDRRLRQCPATGASIGQAMVLHGIVDGALGQSLSWCHIERTRAQHFGDDLGHQHRP